MDLQLHQGGRVAADRRRSAAIAKFHAPLAIAASRDAGTQSQSYATPADAVALADTTARDASPRAYAEPADTTAAAAPPLERLHLMPGDGLSASPKPWLRCRLSCTNMLGAMDERTIRIRLLDVGCVGEALGLERRLARTLGVLGAMVNSATDTAYIRYDAFTTSPDRLRAAIAAAGFRTTEPIAS